MMKKNQKWLLVFSLFSFISVSLLISFCVYINPYSTFNLGWHLPYKSDRNPNVAKLTRLDKKKNTQCLVVGSSRSEFFLPKDIESRSGCSSFSASVPGARSYEKYAFSRYALDNLNELKQIWYIVDFYEFNQKNIPAKIRHIDKLGVYFNDPIFKKTSSSKLGQISHLFSMTMLRASFRNFKEYIRGYKSQGRYLDDGSTTKALTVKLAKDFKTRVKLSIKQYQRGEWGNYKELSSTTFKMLEKLKKIALSKGVQINFIITPLVREMKVALKGNTKLKALTEQMSSKLKELESPELVRTWDFLNGIDIIPNDSDHWLDAAHMTRTGSQIIINHVIKTRGDLDILKKQ